MVLLMRRLVPRAFAAGMLAAMVSLTGCGPQPAYQVVQARRRHVSARLNRCEKWSSRKTPAAPD